MSSTVTTTTTRTTTTVGRGDKKSWKNDSVVDTTWCGKRVLSSTPQQQQAHPLDPLSADEIEQAAEAVKQALGDEVASRWRFTAISMLEPPKAILWDYLQAATSTSSIPPRQAEVLGLDPTTGVVTEFVVEWGGAGSGTAAAAAARLQTEHPVGVQPLLTPDDCDLAEAIVQASTEVAQAIEERYGISDMSRIACDPWSVHLANEEDEELTNKGRRRLVQTFLYYRKDGSQLESNHYAHPIDILPVVDLHSQTVITIQGMDRQPPPSIPQDSVNYHRDLLHTNSYLANSWREERLAMLNVVQPEGPTFQVDGNQVSWQKWKFRVGFNYREGLVLHNVTYEDRPILYRASLVEMAVPYADPHYPFQRKCAFDVGDYGLGYCANSLELGCDCLGHIHYFDAILNDASGQPVTKPKAICMHEEDVGILWKHVEYRNGHNESRRSRELVISSIATVVNYEYLFYWRFKQDGTIHFDIKLSGELSTNLLSADETKENNGQQQQPTHGVMVAKGVNAQIHQHMFCARLDMAVDGRHNQVSEVDIITQPLHPQTNPYGNAFGPMETLLEKEQDAIRTADPTKARTWKIYNPTKANPITQKPVAYKLHPFTTGMAQPTLLTHPTSAVSQKGAFATANLWVTQHHDQQRYPSGDFTPQADLNANSNGLPFWTRQNRNITDAVLWHAFGVAHVPRVEDFPVMPCEITGFSLKPDGFFTGNPAIDIPPDTNVASQLAESSCCSTDKK